MERCYSSTGDEWAEFQTAIEQICEDKKDGDIFSLAEGDCVQVPIEKFVCAYTLLEQIAENAVENYGEYAENFASHIDDDKAVVKELQSALEMVVSGWAKKHKRVPDFFDVENVVWYDWKVIDADDYEVEALQP